jgi:hypothetical protein
MKTFWVSIRMRRITAVAGFTAVSLLSLAPTSVLSAQAPFEGAVTMRITAATPSGGAQPQEMEYLVRNGKVRVNMSGPGGGMSVLTSPQEQKLFVLIPMQNAYMEMPMAEVQSRAPGVPSDVKIIRTGKMETVAGYACEHVTMVNTGSPAVDVCLASGMGNFINPLLAMQRGAVPAWQRSITADGGFPLKITMADGSVPVEVLTIEKKRLANDLFTVPLTYTKMPMPSRR